MRALAKLERAPGLTLTDVAKPEVGHNEVLIKIKKTAICGTDLPHLEMGRVGAKDDSGPDAGRPRICRRGGGHGHRGARFRHRRPRLRRGPHHLRPLPQLPRRTPASVPQHGRRRRQPRRRLRRISLHSRLQRLQDPGRDQRRDGLHPRSLRQRHAYGLELRPGGRGCADHRRRADRHHGGRDLPPCRRAARRDHRRERLPPRPSAQDGRQSRRQRFQGQAEGRDERARHGRRFRRGPRNVRRADRLLADARAHESRRQDRPARHPARQHRRSTGTR